MPDITPEGAAPIQSQGGLSEATPVAGQPIEVSNPQALGGAAPEAVTPIAAAPAVEPAPVVSTEPAPTVVTPEPAVDAQVSTATATPDVVPQVGPRALNEAQKTVQVPVEKPKGKSLKQRLMFWKHDDPAPAEQKPPTAIPTPV